jgi:hypothetical protein
MADHGDYRLRIVADETFVALLKDYTEKRPKEISVQSEAHEKDATKLGFNLADVLTVITIIKTGCDLIIFAKSVTEWFSKSKSNKITLQTPFATLELQKNTPVSEADVLKFLEAAKTM